MTREEASFILANIDRRVCNDELSDALDMAIKALEEQKPCKDCISREEAIKQIQRYGVGCFDADDFSVEQCTRFVIGKLNELDSVKLESEVEE